MAFAAPPQTESNAAAILEAGTFTHPQEDHDSPRPLSRHTTISSVSSLPYTPGFGHEIPNKSKTNNTRVSTPYSMSSRQTRNSTSTRTEHFANRVVRTLPSWIESYEIGEEDHGRGRRLAAERLLRPSPVPSAAHRFDSTTPADKSAIHSTKRLSHDGWVDDDEVETSTFVAKIPERNMFGMEQKPERGRKWDHVRSDAPIILQNDAAPASTWIPFIKSSMYGPSPDEEGLKVDPAFLNELTPGYEKPWRGDVEGEDMENILGLSYHRRRRAWYSRLQHMLLTHPLVPLAFRLTTFATSVIALALACSAYRKTNKDSNVSQNPSTIMAIAVDVIAMPYIFYITYFEYMGKPLGLRDAKVKISLVLGDLLFIVFESANASLAFDAVTDQVGACKVADSGTVCRRQAALCAILLLALLAWTLTFTVSIFRLVEKFGSRGDDDDDDDD